MGGPLSADSTIGGEGGGGAVRFRPIQPVVEGGGGGGGADVSFRPILSMRSLRSRQIQPVDGGCCPLTANSASGGAHDVNRGGGGRHSVPKPPPGDAHARDLIFLQTEVEA